MHCLAHAECMSCILKLYIQSLVFQGVFPLLQGYGIYSMVPLKRSTSLEGKKIAYEENKMKKTVVLMASPRLQSNTDILANRIMDGIREAGEDGDEILKVDLVELQEFVCCACGQCRSAGECLQFPEVNELLDEIKQCDGIVLATPTWWLGPSSLLKIFMDHWGAFLTMEYTSRIAGKRAIVVSCCGNPQVNLSDQVCRHLSEILSFLGVKVKGTLGVKGVAEIGAVSRNAKALEQAFELGRRLYADDAS